jgi:5-methylcytosine-specific restriction endonuclease McrA
MLVSMNFTFPEDRTHFADLLCDGDAELLSCRYGHLFDFRDPAAKRADFNRVKQDIRRRHLAAYGPRCMLQYPGICTGGPLVLDHFIPLSSNVLNKELRTVRAQRGKKVPTQSFGSNHPDNLVLACERCNAFKKHRLPDRELVARVRRARGEPEGTKA